MDNNNTSQTSFDNMTQRRELQMLKTMLPYMKEAQKRQFAILIKYAELQNTIQLFSQNTAALSMCSVEKEQNNVLCMLEDLRRFCTERELETLDTIANMFSMLETYETLFS